MQFIQKHRGQLIVISAIVAISTLFGIALYRLTPQDKPAFERQLLGEWEYKSTIPLALTAYYKKNDTDVTVRVERDNNSLEFSYPFQNTSIEYKNETLIYKSQNLPIETRYNVVPGGIKEEIVLYKIPQETTFSSIIKTSGVSPTINADGIIAFYDSNGVYQFHFERPFVKDAKGDVSYAVRYNLKKQSGDQITEGKTQNNDRVELPLLTSNTNSDSKISSFEDTFILDIEVDPTWLHNPARVLPVVIDPTVTHNTTALFATGQFNNVKDTGSGSSPQLEGFYQELPADTNTVALWHMNEASGNALDSSGNGNTSTVQSATVVAGMFGNARNFNGSNQYVAFTAPAGSTLDIDTNPVTMEAWIKFNSITGSNQYVVSRGRGGNQGYGILVTGTGLVNVGSHGGSNFSGATVLTPGTWYHIAGVINGADSRLYINGTLDGTGTVNVVASDLNLNIGATFDGASIVNYFGGAIDDVRITRGARSHEEIKASASRRPTATYTSDILDLTKVAIWNSFTWTEGGVQTGDGETLSNTSGLVAHWKFNESSGTTAANNNGSCSTTCNGSLPTFSNTTGRDVIAQSGWTQSNRRWGEGALMFDGVDDRVEVGNQSALNFSGSFTISAWIKTSQIPAAATYPAIMGKGFLQGSVNGYGLYLNGDNGGQIGCQVRNSATISFALGGNISDNNWHHVTCVRDHAANTTYLYVDGQLRNQNTTTLSLGYSNTMSFAFGMRDSGTWGFPFQGAIDSASAYSRALTSAEILANYNSTALELQTRVGATADPNDGTWEAWSPVTSETPIESFDTNTMYSSQDSGLIAYWPMDETQNDTCTGGVNDVCDIKTTNDMQVSGTSIGNGVFGNARQLPGGTITDYVSKSSFSSFPSNTVSVEFWVKTNDSGDGIFSYASSTSDNDLLIFNSSNIGIYRGVAGVLQTGVAINDNEWHHIVVTWTSIGGTTQLYVDGSLVYTGTIASGTPIGQNGTLMLGQEQDSVGGGLDAAQAFHGLIDELRIYNQVIPATTVRKNYLSGSTNPTFMQNSSDSVIKVEGQSSRKVKLNSFQSDFGVIGHWTLDETSGTSAFIKNRVSNAYHGTPVGTASTIGVQTNARTFNGSSEYIDMGDIDEIDNATALTSCAWVYHNSTTADHNIWAKGNGATDGILFFRDDVGSVSGRTDIYTIFIADSADTDNTRIESTTNSAISNQWNHVCFSYTANSANGLRLYINGKQDANSPATTAGISAISGGANPFRIGSNSQGGGYFHGKIDDVIVWNRVLGISSIAEIYRAGKDHRQSFFISPVNIQNKQTLIFDIAADKPGNYLNFIVGETENTNDYHDGNTVAFLRLNEEAGSGAYIKDSTGFNNHGTPTGTTFIQGKVGGGRVFNGTSDVIIVPAGAGKSLDIDTNPVTIEAWVRPNDVTTTTQAVVARGRYGNQGYAIRLNGSTFNVGSHGGGNFNGLTSVVIGRWYHVVAIINGVDSALYLNGQLDQTGTVNVVTSDLDLRIGAGFDGTVTSNYFNGAIDEVRISNIARSPQEIRNAYEIGQRTHPVTIEFGAKLDNANTISDSNDLSFTVDATPYGISQKGDKLYRGDIVIVRENYNGTEYTAQGTVNSVVPSTGAVTVASWQTGSTFPPVGFSQYADVFKWQTQYWNITLPLNEYVDNTSLLTLRLTNSIEARTIWIDDLRTGGSYLTNPTGSPITSSIGSRYFQYRTLFHSADEAVSANLSSVSLQYTINSAPNTPLLNSPANGATAVSRTPTLYTTATDINSDYLQYRITLCTDSNMTQNCQTFDQTQSQTGWSQQNANDQTAYNSGTQGTYTLSTPLNYWTTYYWKSTAIDPDGINTWSGTQVTAYSFTTTPIEPATNCKVTRVGTTNVVEWTDNATTEAGYAIQRNVNNGGWTNLNMGLAANTVSYNDTPVQNNTTYQYRVAPYLSGPQYTAWCETSVQNISVGTLRFEGNFNFSGLEIQ